MTLTRAYAQIFRAGYRQVKPEAAGLGLLRNSAQFCTIFLMQFILFTTSDGTVWIRIGKCTKNETNVARR